MKTFRTLFFALFFVTNHVTAAVYISTQSGNWNSAATWGGAGFPGPNDDAVISVGHTVTYNIPGAGDKVQNLEIFGVLEMRSSTLRVEQNLTIDGDIIRDLSVAIGEIKLIGTGVVQLNNNSFSHTEMELVFSSPGYIIAGNGNLPVLKLTEKTYVADTADILIQGQLRGVDSLVTGVGSIVTYQSNENIIHSVAVRLGNNSLFRFFSSGDFNGGLDATANGCTFEYGNSSVSGDVAVKFTPYYNLTISKHNSNGIVYMEAGGGIGGTATEVLGDMVVEENCVFQMADQLGNSKPLTVHGAVYSQGTMLIPAGAGGTLQQKTFGDLTVDSTGSFENYNGEAITINGDLINDGYFVSDTGTYHFTSLNGIIGGDSVLTMFHVNIVGCYENHHSDLRLETFQSLPGACFKQMPGAALSFVDFPDTDDFWGTFTADTAGNTVRHLGNGIVSSLIPSAGYFDFEINKPSGRLDLVGDLVINGTINFVNGKIQLGTHHLWLEENAVATGGSNTSYAYANGSGEYRKRYNGADSVTFMVGSLARYSPLSLNLTGATLDAVPYIGVRVVDAIHPEITDFSNYITRYWMVRENDINNPVYDVFAQYSSTPLLDVVGTESDLFALRWFNNNWEVGEPADVNNHILAMYNQTGGFGDFTGGRVCRQPTGVAVSVSSDTALFSWDADPVAIGGQIQNRVHPNFGGGGLTTTIFGAGVNSKEVSGHTCGVNYQSRMRFNCDNGILSPFKFKPYNVPACRLQEDDVQIFVYPNPVADYLQLVLRGFANAQTHIIVSDLAGKEFFSKTIFPKSTNEVLVINEVDKWGGGVFILSVESSTKIHTRKVVR